MTTSYNIFSFLPFDRLSLKKVADTGGGEYAGPCPWCGGEDRFRVFPNGRNRGTYFCRQCGKAGDAIQFLREFHMKSYEEACRLLEIGDSNATSIHAGNDMKNGMSEKTVTSRSGFKNLPKVCYTSRLWQNKANYLVNIATASMWTPEASRFLNYLLNRGFTPETIYSSKLGCNVNNQFENRSDWDLPEELKPNGKLKKVWIPTGIIIPCSIGCQIVRIRIRKEKPSHDDSRYLPIPGSDFVPMSWGLDHANVVIVESELDGLLIWQEARDLIGVIALGSVNIKPNSQLKALLKTKEKILVALDFDKAGCNSWRWWRDNYENSCRWNTPEGKDPGEAAQAGLNIRNWIKAGLLEVKLAEQKQAKRIVSGEVVEGKAIASEKITEEKK